MWGICAFFNPFLALMTIAICDDVVISAHMDDSLAILGNIVGGEWLKMLISVDAFIVLRFIYNFRIIIYIVVQFLLPMLVLLVFVDV